LFPNQKGIYRSLSDKHSLDRHRYKHNHPAKLSTNQNHNLKQALGTLPGPYRQKHMARELMGVQRGKTTSQQKEDIKEKYKNYNGRDFTNRKGPYNFYGTDLKLDDMKKVIKRDLQKKDLSFEKRKKLRNFNN